MPKHRTEEQQQTFKTCVCGWEGQAQFSAMLKDGSRQLYCSRQCMEHDGDRQRTGGQGKQKRS